ncbi:MAG TPA: glycosyltransferase 87 family protein [Tepidisphaeraceae bacterium]|nr:glycosyltransferase 87 family protein [Tepidisphaeraceae bacterium]
MTSPAYHVASEHVAHAGAAKGTGKPGVNVSTPQTINRSIVPAARHWFWFVFALGLSMRLYLALFTQGTYDVSIWHQHAVGVHQQGLIAYYHSNHEMNHPPFIAEVVAGLWDVSNASGLPFRILLRLPVIVVDVAIVALLLWLLRAEPRRFIVATIYWLNPLAIIFSAYHGNIDTIVAFCILLCVCLLAKQRIIWAAIALGVSVWFKLPGVLVAPALALFVPSWPKRLRFSAVAAAVALSTYVPALLLDAPIVRDNVFAYHGQMIQTSGRIPIWGARLFLADFDRLSPATQEALAPVLTIYYEQNRAVCLGLILVWSWLRRRERSVRALSLTITGVYCILYAFSNNWSFQYVAWSVPFWCLTNVWFALVATILAGGYIYGVYALACGNLWLLGKWDFAGHPFWPQWLIDLRDAALLLFIATSVYLLAAAVYAEVRRLIPRRIQYQSASRSR